MKKFSLFLCLILIVSLFSIPSIANNTADFVLTEDNHNIKASEILAVEGSIVVGENRPEPNLIYASVCENDEYNTNQMFHRVFKGDVITFTVDFGSDGYESFGYYSFGGAKDSVFEFYIDNSLIGEGKAKGGNGWADNNPKVWFYDEIAFGTKYTGIHEIKIVVIDSAESFPANAFGKFIFNKKAEVASADFVLDKDVFNIKGQELIERAEVNNIPEQWPTIAFDANVPAADPGQMLFNVCTGDTIKFTADFGSRGYTSMSFSDYGLAAKTVFEMYIDGELIGTGEAVGANGWADNDMSVWNTSTIEFGKTITGIHTVEFKVVESAAGWPYNVFGNFLFYASKEVPDFTLTEDNHNIKASEILAVEGSIVVGENRPEPNLIYASVCENDEYNTNQMFHRVFKGDVITFTVDFGSDGYESFGYYSFGGAKDSVFEFYIDNSLIGEGKAKGGNGWADNDPKVWFYDEIAFGTKYTGIHEIKIVVTDSAESFPANAFGKFIFNKKAEVASADFVLDKDAFNIKGQDLVEKAEVNNLPGQWPTIAFDANLPATNPGQMLFNVCTGNTIKFTADFGTKGYTSMNFSDYGLAPKTVFEMYIDGELIGVGEAVGANGWADNDMSVWNTSTIEFGKTITGIHTVEFKVIESAAGWPYNVFGNFVFNEVEKTVTPENPGIPEIGDNSLFVLLAVVVVSMGTLYFVAISRRKANV